MSVLVASGQVYLLEAYHRNLGKRLIKTPKVHILDTGLAIFLMGYQKVGDVFSSPLGGAIWETHVVNQLLRYYAFQGRQPPLWYWRTVQGQEVDVLIEEGGGRLIAIEAKHGEHPGGKEAEGIRAARKFYGEAAVPKGYVASRTPANYEIERGIEAVEGSEWEGLLR